MKTPNRMHNETCNLLPIDRGWAWIVAIMTFCNSGILIGFAKSCGIIFAELVDMYKGQASSTSAMLALSAGLTYFLAPCAAKLSDACSCRIVSMIGGAFTSVGLFVCAYCRTLEQTVISFGILTGIGYSFVLCSNTIAINEYFNNRRAMANGLMLSGAGFGGIITPLFINYILDQFGLRLTYVALSCVAMQIVVTSAFLRPMSYWKQKLDRSDQDELSDEDESRRSPVSTKYPCPLRMKTCLKALIMLIKNKPLVIYIVATAITIAGICVGLIIPMYCAQVGISGHQAALILSIQCVASLIGQLFMAGLGDRRFVKKRKFYIQLLWCIVCIICMIGITQFRHFWSIAIFASMASLSLDAFIVMTPVILVDLVGEQKFSHAWGLLGFGQGFSVTLSPVIMGLLSDWTKTYGSALWYTTGCFAAAAGCITLLILTDRRRNQRLMARNVIEES